MSAETFELKTIARVVGGRIEPTDDYWGGTRSIIRIDDPRFMEEATAGLSDFSHLEIVFRFHLTDPTDLNLGARRPRDNPDWPPIGTFGHRMCVRAQWRPATDGAGEHIRTQVRSILALLTWIDERDLVLGEVNQGHIDLQPTRAAKTREHIAGSFVTWLRQRGLVGQIAIPDKRRRGNPPPLPDEERWAALRRCRTDDVLPDDVRAARNLVLFYGLTLSRTTRLWTEELEHAHTRTARPT